MDILLLIPIHKKKRSISSILNVNTITKVKDKISNTKSDTFIKLLEGNNFIEIQLKIKKNYSLYQHKLIKMFYIRVYYNKYCIYPLCNSDHWLYKEELFNDITFGKDNLLFNLIKDNEFTEYQINN